MPKFLVVRTILLLKFGALMVAFLNRSIAVLVSCRQ